MAMTENEFWALIADKIDRSDVTELDISALEAELADSPAERIAAFAAHFERLHQRSYQNRLWGAAYLINGGCSDDGFDYFRGWLIGMGREVYDAAINDPDSLADLAAEDVECEDLLYAANAAYEEVTGSELDIDVNEAVVEDDDDWDFDDNDEMRARYPRLFARFCE